ncbi:unnamed protein product [Caenorhabditis nigoni]|uniref:Uncharacterized protein n=1 Tax=Caenorhabditis nigoni TaxID=1611254 RepID=A0A2G5SC90_9PELO|nr:hypothetical protein B9Z55_028210 [Caenorhabditis nigoni]
MQGNQPSSYSDQKKVKAVDAKDKAVDAKATQKKGKPTSSRFGKKKQHKSEWIWSPDDYPLPEYPEQRFPKEIPQGPARVLNYKIEDLDKEFKKP